MTIHAVNPTGDTYRHPPQPIWRFAITNTGSCTAVWKAFVDVRGGPDRDYSVAGGFIEWPMGILEPGRSVVTNMIVPAKTGSVWRASIGYWPLSPQDLKKAQEDAARFGGLSVAEWCPHHPDSQRTYNDGWHH